MDGRRISRRDFLKLLGCGTLVLGLGTVLKFGGLSDLKRFSPQLSFAQQGSWSQGQNTPAVAIHSALLPSGKIFYVAGSGYHTNRPNGPFEARILDPNTNSETNMPLTEDLFCGGAAGLPDGNLLFVGGTLIYDQL